MTATPESAPPDRPVGAAAFSEAQLAAEREEERKAEEQGEAPPPPSSSRTLR